MSKTDLDLMGEEHEKHAQEFLTKVRAILLDALKLSEDANPDVFHEVANLRADLRKLFTENSYVTERRAKERVAKALETLANDAIRSA